MKGENTMKTKNKSNKNQTSEIPTTGRIGRFAKIIEKKYDRDIVEKVMQDSDKYESFNYAEKAAWWKGAIERLEKEVGKETAIKIMESCGRKCCGLGHRKTAKKLMGESKSIKEFLNKLNKKFRGVRFKLKDKNTVVVRYDKCLCGQVKQTKQPFPTTTYCQCGVAWEKQFFESALEIPVEVELVQTVITGAESCKFLIHI
jgi:predicted hydrocarbon binding protein